ncbi:secretion protein HlyD [Marinicella pacifica]|uniref:Secretion protein HlyD n=1 Tax=Marinicella pacifica TaxID=1171543 RepID=A0A917FJZ3_9GAMM|nr:efflux RND transporter periplasmic adaptor subunit [Marinicella pacifica]GGF84681.1 secretion protein HlyD [Marinicella pacifica]
MKKSTLFTGLIVVILLIVVAWLLWPQSAPQNGQGMAGPGGYGAQGPVPVETMQVQQKEIEMTMELPARVVAYRQSEVRPQVSGIIEERLFEQGSLVEKGQKLYQLDDARYLANLNSAEADLQNARAQLKTIKTRAQRIRSLEAQQAVSEQDLDDVEAQLAQAEAAIAVAQANVDLQKINIEYAQIKAPISGRIGQSFLTEGALVSSGQDQPLAIITQLSPIYVDMQVSADRAQRVMAILSRQQLSHREDGDNAGQETRLKVTVNQGGGQQHSGYLAFSDVVVDETTGAVTLRAVLDNDAMNLLPGMFVTATLHLGSQQEILVPQRAAARNPLGGLDVWVVNADNSAEKKTFQSQHAYQDQWIVADGVEAGETIVVVGYQKLQPGAQVTPSPWQGASQSLPATQHQQQANPNQQDNQE